MWSPMPAGCGPDTRADAEGRGARGILFRLEERGRTYPGTATPGWLHCVTMTGGIGRDASSALRHVGPVAALSRLFFFFFLDSIVKVRERVTKLRNMGATTVAITVYWGG